MKPWRILLCLAIFIGVSLPAILQAYPLDGYRETGIRRLEASRLAHQGLVAGDKQPEGSLWPTDQIRLKLSGSGSSLPGLPDPGFTAEIIKTLDDRADRYSLLVLDLTDPDQPRYAEHRADEKQNVGSVGKLVSALGLFQALADTWPDDISRRQAVLRNTPVTADEFSVSDHHTIRIFDVENHNLIRRPMQAGDVGSLWEQLDWTLSVSSNSAASMVMREVMLLRHLGIDYPMENSAIQGFFKNTPAPELTRIFQASFWEPVTRNGLNPDQIRQGSFFTKGGQKTVNGGGNSYATARSLLEFTLLMERGQLVDEWSSLELKKLLYVTERRIRYASSPALTKAAVFSKSGSLYSCQAEAGFTCYPYHGNVMNYMNSVSIIEQQVGETPVYYMVILVSNVLRENSAVTHQNIATRIHQLILQTHGLETARP